MKSRSQNGSPRQWAFIVAFAVLLVMNAVLLPIGVWKRDLYANISQSTITEDVGNADSSSKCSGASSRASAAETTQRSRLGDGCYHVYLDVGANIGIHGRFLYEPEKYPLSKRSVPLFDEMYGQNRSNEDYCVFEVEANDRHWGRLENVSEAYRQMGWSYNVVKAAAFDKVSTMTFFHQGSELGKNEWGFSIKSGENQDHKDYSKVEVPTLRLADWIRHEILDRQIPETTKSGRTYDKPIIGMKFDIEASELVVLPDMLMTGVLCNFDFMFGEYHRKLVPMTFENPTVTVKKKDDVKFLKDAMKAMLKWARNCNTKFLLIDDESYLHDGLPFPTPGGD